MTNPKTADGASGNNDMRRDDLLKEVKKLGGDKAEGDDSLAKLAHRLVRAAADGVIGTVKDNDGRDDASKFYEAFIQERSKKAIHEHTDGGVKANVSKLRKLIEMGVMPVVDPVNVMNRAKDIREASEKADNKVKPAYAGYVDLAREQLANPGRELDDDEIRNVLLKPEPKEKTLEREIQGIHKRVERLITGEGGIKDQSPEVIQVEELLRTRLAALLQKIEDDKFALMAAERGIALVTEQAQAA